VIHKRLITREQSFCQIESGRDQATAVFVLAKRKGRCYLESMKNIARNKKLFTAEDIRRMKIMGLAPADLEKQLAIFRRGSVFLRLSRPCSAGDGIWPYEKLDKKKMIAFFEQASAQYRIMKFVPASGAASRMFAEWFRALENHADLSSDYVESFFRNLKKYPFYPDIRQDRRALRFIARKDLRSLLSFILSESASGFGAKPKALIPFHRYSARESRTALEEHLAEAAFYLRDRRGVCRVHFTVSPEHQASVEEKIKDVASRYEKRFGVQLSVSTSLQSPSTNTLAVDEFNLPLRDAEGNLVFRPGGHGTLLKNLQEIEADFIFIKNIDNVVPERILRKILPSKKILGGLAIRVRQQMVSFLNQLEQKNVTSAQLDEMTAYCSKMLNMVFPRRFAGSSSARKKEILFSLLNRPLRVCAVVRNQGEPGGAPFWVDETDGRRTPQIVEGAQVDKNDRRQWTLWHRAEYFNPVDMVCCTKDYRGKNFHLMDFVNHNAYLITQKSEKGILVRALEYPGLWNGGMACWNTVFVEMPLMIFNPVKTADDLLRPQHSQFKKKSGAVR